MHKFRASDPPPFPLFHCVPWGMRGVVTTVWSIHKDNRELHGAGTGNRHRFEYIPQTPGGAIGRFSLTHDVYAGR